MVPTLTYADAVAKAEHLKALGITTIFISDNEPPWRLATACQPAEVFRGNVRTSAWFEAADRGSGLAFRWSYDLDGDSWPRVDPAAVRAVLGKLPPGPARAQFAGFLAAVAEQLRTQAAEYQSHADRYAGGASTLAAEAAEATKAAD